MRRATWLVVAVLLASCGVADGVVEAGDTLGQVEGAATAPVRLLEAHSVIGTVNADGKWTPYRSPLADFGYGARLAGLARGVVEVPAATSTSKVFVHYASRASNDWNPPTWQVVEAKRVDAKRFEFATPPMILGGSFHYLPRFVHTFAIEHRRSGRSDWDNNGGHDYVVSGDDDGGWVPVFAGPPAVFNAGNVVVERAWWDGAVLRGSALVRNVGWGKKVRLAVSVNGWSTVRDGTAQYVKTFSSTDIERWSFEVAAPALESETVQFAVALDRPDGQTEWDNNLSRDYTLRLDGVGSPWALGPVQSPGRLVFEGPEAGWSVRFTSTPPADGAMVLVYAPSRLTKCRATKYGMPAWGLTPWVRAPRGGAFSTPYFLKDGVEYPKEHLRTPVFFVAGGALEAYFVNSDVYGCVAYDSNYGQNHLLRW